MTMTKPSSTRRTFIAGSATVAGAAAVGASMLFGDNARAHEIEINAMRPTPQQMQQFLALPDGPIVMVNLLKFKPDGGREEYQRYAQKIQPILKKIGARILFSGEAKVCMIGNGDWDQIALVEYPDKMSLPKMAQSAEYQAAHRHREAGLQGQVNYAVVQNEF